MDLSKYRQLFLDECREHLQGLSRELLALEKEAAAFTGVDAMFRAAHSVKGMSASMGYDAMVGVSHALEEIIDRIRKKSLVVGPGVMRLLYEGLDTLGALANEVEERGATSLAVEGLVARLKEAASAAAPLAGQECPGVQAPSPAPAARAPEGAPAPAPAPPAADFVPARGGLFDVTPGLLEAVRGQMRDGLVPYACRLLVDKNSAALAARNFIILGRLAKLGSVLASAPTLEEVRAGRSRTLVEALLLSERPEEQLRSQLLALPELQELQVRRLQLGEGESGGDQDGGGLLAPREATIDRPAGASPGLADRYAPKKAATVRVDTRVLDDLINIVGELIINRERLLEIARDLQSDELDANLGRLDILVREFQGSIMTVRMMPLDFVIDRLPRIVRDIAHQSGKQVTFEVFGKGVELDRAILEELHAVLIHLVRNAIDHGVESPAERAAAGKSPKGLIRIRAGRERDWVWIRVEDDGRGMDPERIAAVAVARGLVTAERAAALEPREKLLLACLPGVSTAERVTDVSGRGVGMDVVKHKLDAFGGVFQIDSTPGSGTSFTLRLPLTLAIIRILLVEVRGREFGLPVSHVLRASHLGPDGVEWSQQRPLLHWEKRLVPLADLGELLGLPPRDLRGAPGFFVAVTEFGGRVAGLVVDRLLGTYEVVVKPLGPPLKRVRGLAGVTIMGDGRTILLLDVSTLV